VQWTDAKGEWLMNFALSRGHPILMEFATLADAQACHARLLRERSRQ
jgi:hypothetical protein